MCQQMYESEDFCYSYNKDAGSYNLTTKKYKISITLTGEEAVLFGSHIDLIRSKPDNELKKRIERVIGIHLYFYITSKLDNDNFKDELNILK